MKPVSLGTPKSPHATRVLLLGSGELGKEVVIELQRFGVEVIACDRYADAPAMQVAHRSHVIDMLDRKALRALVEQEKPHLIVPEIEAIATQELVELEKEGWTVIPTAQAARLTMDREAIRRVAAEELKLPTARRRPSPGAAPDPRSRSCPPPWNQPRSSCRRTPTPPPPRNTTRVPS